MGFDVLHKRVCHLEDLNPILCSRMKVRWAGIKPLIPTSFFPTLQLEA